MKKEIRSIILMGVLIISLTGCNVKSVDTKKAQGNKPATVKVSMKPADSKDKQAVQSTDTQKISTDNNATNNKPAPSPAPNETTKTTTAPAQQKPESSAQVKTSEYYSNAPATSIDSIQISPKHVYYKDSVLYMDAYVYNGFNHNVFNIKNVGIKLSNNSGVIAEENFDGLGNKVIGPNSYIVWTFIFSQDAVKQQNANLQILKTEYKCDNSY